MHRLSLLALILIALGGALPLAAQPGAENGGKPEFGNLSKNPISGPGYWNVDASLFRNFNITERWRLQFRAQALSIKNTPQWGNPSTDINSANFGFITGVIFREFRESYF